MSVEAAYLPIRQDRYSPCIQEWSFIGKDFTSAVFASQIRRIRDDVTALITLATVGSDTQGIRLLYAGADTVQNHIAAGRLRSLPAGLQLSDTVTLSQVRMKINKANVTALPAAEETGDNVTLAWDLHITPSGGYEAKWFYGEFVVEAGATNV